MTLPPAAPVAHGALALDGVGVRFGWRTGLADVSVTVARSRRLAIVGPSGAGKTTLLRAVAGLAPVVNGRILVDGRDVTALSPEKRDIVYLHQTPVLFEHLSVGENVAFPLRVRRVRDDDVRVRVAAALTAMQLPGLESRAPRTLSGGQRHRVALARAIVARPAVLLLDEPLSALDLKLRQHMRAELRAIQKRTNVTFIYITHDQGEALAMSDRVAVMSHGRLQQVARPQEIYNNPVNGFVASFVGENNIFAGEVGAISGGIGEFKTTSGTFRAKVGQGVSAGTVAKLYVRPENTALAAVPRPNANNISVEVADVAFEGNFVNIAVKNGDGRNLTVEARNDGTLAIPPTGSKLQFAFDPDKALVLADALTVPLGARQ